MKFSFDQALLSQDSISPLAQSLESYRKHLRDVAVSQTYTTAESSICLPGDTALLEQMKHAAAELHSPTLQYVVVIGIGGSNLGTQAIYESIAGSMNLLVDRLPKLLFLDTVTDEKMTAVTRVLEQCTSKDDFLAIVISKSGTTTETIANTEVLWGFAKEQFGEAKNRFVCITDEGSKLWKLAHEKRMICFAIPEQVGGRFSVFSAVGLLPIALSGISISELLTGANQAVMDGISNDHDKNHSLVSACVTHLHVQKGRTIRNTFLFSPKLESLGKWERQLVGESLGKDNQGVTPIVSIGSTDLHSMAQLYWGGPDDKLTTLVHSFTGAVHSTPNHLALPGLVADIQSTSLEEIMQAIYGGVKSAYEQKKRPFVEIDLGQADAYELGYYLQFRMLEVMYLGKLMNINTFDQPAVEMYKSVTRTLLKG